MGKRNYKKFYAGAIGAVWGAQRAIEEVPMTVREKELLSIMVKELLYLADMYVPEGRHAEHPIDKTKEDNDEVE